MSEVRRQRSSACWRFEASRQPVGVLPRRLAVGFALERQPQGRGSVCSVRDSVSATDTSFQSHMDIADLVYRADYARTVGRVVRSRRVSIHDGTPKGSSQ